MYLTIFGKPRYLGLVVVDNDIAFEKGEQILVESSRGIETAVVAGEITERQECLYRAIDNRQEGQASSEAGLQNIYFLRQITENDLVTEKQNRQSEDAVLVTARQVLSRHALDMKLVDVEYMHDRKKLFLYFTSEQRVDFRAYVRDLAREFKTRIELRQIGVRDESKVVKGLGACGRVCCCSYWLQKFMPIGIKMVKEQNLALNPTKISGLCGRLMCCMSFEQDNYRDLWKKLPSHGSKIKTEQGTWVLTGVDLGSRSCSIHGPNGTVSVPVGQFSKFKETILAGKAWHTDPEELQDTDDALQSGDREFFQFDDGRDDTRCGSRSCCSRGQEDCSLSSEAPPHNIDFSPVDNGKKRDKNVKNARQAVPPRRKAHGKSGSERLCESETPNSSAKREKSPFRKDMSNRPSRKSGQNVHLEETPARVTERNGDAP